MTVFVCVPFAPSEAGLEKMRACCAREVELGNVPFAPQLFFAQFLDDEPDGKESILLGLEILGRLDELHVYGGRSSKRMQQEIAYAKSAGIPVLHMC